MSDLSDLQAIGDDARVKLAAFVVTLEALSDPHYQFKAHVQHLRTALFLLTQAGECVAHAVTREQRKVPS